MSKISEMLVRTYGETPIPKVHPGGETKGATPIPKVQPPKK